MIILKTVKPIYKIMFQAVCRAVNVLKLMFLRVSKYLPNVIFRNVNINVQRLNVTGSMNWHNNVEPPLYNSCSLVYIYTSRFAASSCKHLKTLISENICCVNSPCSVTIFPLDFKQHYSLKTKPLVSKNGLGRPENDLGGCRDLAYHF